MYNVVMNATDTKEYQRAYRAKAKAAFENHPRTLKRGAVRDDGKVFLCYHARAKNFEHWVTTDQLEKHNKRDAEYKKSVAGTDEVRAYHRRWQRNRRATDPLFALAHRLRNRLNGILREGGYKKNTKTADALGCSYKELLHHIESQFTKGMSWDKMDKIDIDHRLPLAAGKTEEEILALSHHRNIQPMWSEDNKSKGDKYCPKELKRYLTKYL